MPFQTQVGANMAPAVAGDFASANPRSFYPAGPGGLVAGPNGVTIGNFCWLSYAALDSDGAPAIVNSFGAGPVAGFVPRKQQGLITTYLADSSMLIPPGFGLEIMTSGDVWAKNSGTNEAEPGMYAYANVSTGAVTFAAANSPAAGGSGTASTIVAGTASVTGSIAGDVLTVTAVGSGTLVAGGQLSGTGVAPNTAVVNQLTGTPGGIGTYTVNIGEQTVASTTISETYGTLTVGGTVTGTFGVGQPITTGASAGTVITALGTGTGGAGTYIVNNTQTVASTTISTASSVQTKWQALSSGLPGEIVKMSSQVLG